MTKMTVHKMSEDKEIVDKMTVQQMTEDKMTIQND